MWFIGVEVEQETSAPPPEKNPGSAPEAASSKRFFLLITMGIRDFNFSCASDSYPKTSRYTREKKTLVPCVSVFKAKRDWCTSIWGVGDERGHDGQIFSGFPSLPLSPPPPLLKYLR